MAKIIGNTTTTPIGSPIILTKNSAFQGINITQHLGKEAYVDPIALTEGSLAIGNETVAGRRGFQIQYNDDPSKMYGSIDEEIGIPSKIQLTCNDETKEELLKLVTAAGFEIDSQGLSYVSSDGIKLKYSTKTLKNKADATLVTYRINVDKCLLYEIESLNNEPITGKNILNFENTAGYKDSDPNHRFTFSIWAEDYPECGTKSISQSSVALNKETQAVGDNSFAVGKGTKALGDYSSTFGQKAVANGIGSMAINQAKANGDNSFAQGSSKSNANGQNSASFNGGVANGSDSVAFGRGATANGIGSAAFGGDINKKNVSEAKGDFSFAAGHGAKAYGLNSVAFNHITQANGDYSSAFGQYTIAGQSSQQVRGRYNVVHDGSDGRRWLDIVGNGQDSSVRSDAYKLDDKGNAHFAGDVFRNNYKRLVDIDELNSAEKNINTRLDKLESSSAFETDISTKTYCKGDMIRYTASNKTAPKDFHLQLSNVSIKITNSDGRYTELHSLSSKEKECLTLKNRRFNILYITPKVNDAWYLVEITNVNFGLQNAYCFIDTNDITKFDSITVYKHFDWEGDTRWIEIDYNTFVSEYSNYSLSAEPLFFTKIMNLSLNNDGIPVKAGKITIYEEISTNYDDVFIFDGIMWHKIYDNFPKGGKTENRPSDPYIGQQWFDTTLNQPIWYNGTTWVTAYGSEV